MRYRVNFGAALDAAHRVVCLVRMMCPAEQEPWWLTYIGVALDVREGCKLGIQTWRTRGRKRR